jgi:shikimate dehydrogenase
MKHFGIIGKPLVQSFSAKHFNKKFADEHIDAEYSLYPLEQIEDFPALI